MGISQTEIRKIAKLARLKFSEEEVSSFGIQISHIMDMIDSIKEVDSSSIEPLYSVIDANLQMVEDIPEKDVDVSELFSNAPGRDADLAKDIKCFVVPKVIE